VEKGLTLFHIEKSTMRIEVSSRELATGERLVIAKNRFMPAGATDNDIAGMPRACIVTGIHGDELEGQFAVFELARRLREKPHHLAGIVDIYPAANPSGIGAIERGIPQFDLDMNRIFPGNNSASPFESMAADLIADATGAQIAFDIHASNIFLRELPQIRINEISAERLIPLAKRANVDFIWIHANATVLKGTFAYSMNALDVPTLVIEAGVGMRITPEVGTQLADGMLAVLADVGIWTGPIPTVRTPTISTDGEVSFVNADVAGVFVPSVEHRLRVEKGQAIGQIIDCGEGTVLQELVAPTSGLLFTLREYPVVYPGSLIARVLGDGPEQQEGRA